MMADYASPLHIFVIDADDMTLLYAEITILFIYFINQITASADMSDNAIARHFRVYYSWPFSFRCRRRPPEEARYRLHYFEAP